MKKLKKSLLFVLALVLIIPTVVAFAGCGQSKASKETIIKSFGYEDFSNVTCTAFEQDDNKNLIETFKIKLQVLEDGTSAMYFNEEDDVEYSFYKDGYYSRYYYYENDGSYNKRNDHELSDTNLQEKSFLEIFPKKEDREEIADRTTFNGEYYEATDFTTVKIIASIRPNITYKYITYNARFWLNNKGQMTKLILISKENSDEQIVYTFENYGTTSFDIPEGIDPVA